MNAPKQQPLSRQLLERSGERSQEAEAAANRGDRNEAFKLLGRAEGLREAALLLAAHGL